MNNQFNTPILYTAFNRLSSVKKTFPEIQKLRPRKLFISCDGPRTKGEKNKTEEVREYLLKNINWDCEVRTLFNKDNLGCKYAMYNAINWFFKQVDRGIILEDDCLPDPSFFKFCEEMLEKYSGEKSIMSITGQSILKNIKFDQSYCFSRYFFCWGWATWRHSWKKMDLEMKKYPNSIKGRPILNSLLEGIVWNKRFKKNYLGKSDSWATSFLFSHIYNQGLCIIPNKNLIENIGLSNTSTNTKGSKYDIKYLHRVREKINFPLKHPLKIDRNKLFDRKTLLHDAKRAVLKKIFLIQSK